jgi:hypothetical protein
MNANYHHLFLTTDEGNTWTNFADFDSAALLSYFFHASRNPGSQKVVFVHTQYITDTLAAGQIDQDVWYMLSSDNGVTWGLHINLTNYQPDDTIRAYCDPYAVFDHNDNLHIVWSGRRVVDGNYYDASKIYHWDEVNDTFTVVNSPSIFYGQPGGWWICGGINYGCWRLPADKPVLVDGSNYLFCLWTGNDDYADTSAGGWINGEIYGSYSTDNGLTWADYVNLTNTRSPGAPPGSCDDEDFLCAHPFVVNDSIFSLYLEDKDAGFYGAGEGTLTDNPIRCWVFPYRMLTGVAEQAKGQPPPRLQLGTIIRGPLQIPEGRSSKIFDIAGREIFTLNPAPGIYFVQIDGEMLNKIIKIE